MLTYGIWEFYHDKKQYDGILQKNYYR